MSLPEFAEIAIDRLPGLNLKRTEAATQAGLWICSLPVPPGAPTELALNGRPTYAKGLGQWPGVTQTAPRRVLLVTDGGDRAPETLTVQNAADALAATTVLPVTTTPTAEMVLLEQSETQKWLWERHSCKIEFQGKSLEIRLGLRTGETLNWMEACAIEVEEETPTCRVVHMAGSIPLWVTTLEMLEDPDRQGYHMPGLHEHHWLSGHLWMRLHSNGVIECWVRHDNSRWVDDGAALDDCVPVIALRCREPGDLPGDWDGTRQEITVDGVRLDVTEAARLATPERPGRMDAVDGWLVWQPYMGVEVYSGRCSQARIGDEWIWRAEQKHMPRGITRSIRFSASLGKRSPKIVRYMAPFWWYGLNCEIQHAPYLPVSDAHDDMLLQQRDWLHVHVEPGGFEDGAIPRGGPQPPLPEPKPRWECGWEGDAQHGMLMLAWRTGDWTDFNNAIRCIYHFTDVVIDHAAGQVRMHGYPPVAFAQPGNRVIGTIMGYLETGDPYLLDSAERVVENAHRNHLNVWPRPAVGRDACYIRGATLLYRYFNNEHFRQIARRGCQSMVVSQRPNGSFGDQSGGAGIHAYGIHITKPWMALLGNMPLLDYLELFPDDQEVHQCVMKTANWMMAIRFKHENGITGWSYQHDYGGKPDFYIFASQEWSTCPATASTWHMDNFARILGYASLSTGDAAYIEAYEESARANESRTGNGDHSIAASQLCLPRLQQWLWRPLLTADGLVIRPFPSSENTPKEARIFTPDGEVPVSWTAGGQVQAPAAITVVKA